MRIRSRHRQNVAQQKRCNAAIERPCPDSPTADLQRIHCSLSTDVVSVVYKSHAPTLYFLFYTLTATTSSRVFLSAETPFCSFAFKNATSPADSRNFRTASAKADATKVLYEAR